MSSVSTNEAAIRAGVLFKEAAPVSVLDGETRSSSIAMVDVVMFALILAFGAIAFIYHQHSSDFLGEDVFYADSARSLLSHGFYGINGHAETNQPPGLPGILATLFAAFGYSYAICLRAMAVFATLGLLATYELLRRHLPRLVAGGICIVLISSPVYFQMATQGVWPCFPVFFTSFAALLAFEEYEKATTRLSKSSWAVALTAATVASVMIASGTIALLGAFVAVTAVTWLKDKRLGVARLKKLLPVLLGGIMVQGLWMHRKPVPLEWPLAGYPGSYLQQLRVKSGNYPELGMAGLGDIPTRIWRNAADQSDIVLQVLVRHGIRTSKTFVVIVPVLIIAAGWAYSIWEGEAALLAWYFAGYEFIYLLWPWTVEFRFFLPIMPLACLYLYKGIEATRFVATKGRRLLGAVLCPVALVLGISGWHWMYTHPAEGLGLYPDEVMAAIWCILAICGAWMALTGQPLASLIAFSDTPGWLKANRRIRRLRLSRLLPVAIVLLVVISVGAGVKEEIEMARTNVRYPDLLLSGDSSVMPMGPEIESAQWIRSRTPRGSVVMARHLPIVYHYADRSLVWFAPISDRDILMKGIVKHGVDYVVVIRHRFPYYLPDDDDCFDRVLAKYSDAFTMVFRDSNLRIFKVRKTLANSAVQR